MVPGAPGLSGLHVPRAVIEEDITGDEFVTVQPRQMEVIPVVGGTQKRNGVTLMCHVL